MTDEQAGSKDKSDATQSEDANADQEDDLDTLLAQYDEENVQEKPQTQKQPASNEKLDMILNYIQNQQVRDQQTEINTDLQGAVKTMKEIIGTESIDDEFLEVALRGYADKNPKFVKAFMDRKQNPTAWKAVVKTVATKMRKYVPKEDDDREAVAAAVKSGSSAKADPEKDFPSEKEIRKMSDAEFNKIWG